MSVDTTAGSCGLPHAAFAGLLTAILLTSAMAPAGAAASSTAKGSAATPAQPDLVIYLQAEPETLVARVRKRGVEMERKIDDDYLIRLGEAYTRFFHNYSGAPVMIVNSENLNFADSNDDFQLLVERIESMRGPREYFNRGD